jgi:hypothetical protein
LANFFASLGGDVPGLIARYDERSLGEEKYNRETAARSSVADILKNLPQVGDNMDALGEMAGSSMTPEQAKGVLATTPPENAAQAAEILAQNRKGLDSLRLAMPDKFQPAPGTEAVLNQFTAQPPKPAQDVIESLRPVIRDMESGGNYGQLHPRTRSGKQALGAYGILPEVWFKEFPQFGLDSSRPEDKQKFLSSPALQDAMFAEIAKKGLSDTGGDLRKWRAWYYGGPSAADSLAAGKGFSPQTAIVNGRTVSMPSVADDADMFMKRLEAAGVDPQTAMAASPGQLPFDASLLQSLVKEPPKLKVFPKKVSYGDQERYMLSKIQNPEQMALLSDHLKAIGDLSRQEREEKRADRQEYRGEVTDYNQNVRALTEVNYNVWKALEEKKKAGHLLRSEELAAARARRDALRNELTAVRIFAAKMVKEEEEKKKDYQALYPEFFTTSWDQPSSFETMFGGKGESVVKYDPALVAKRVQNLESEYESVDNLLADKSRTQNFAEMPNTIPDLSKYLTPRKK